KQNRGINFNMKLTNLSLKDLITEKGKLTFLIGAGCSVDPPSCQPAGKTMMNMYIKWMQTHQN
ncbi:unnamed protein product, partial [marine sediment metagenome]